MSKNVYQFYKEFKNVSIGTSVYSFKYYQHKTKLDVWVVKDIKRTTSFSIRGPRYSVVADEINSFLLKKLPEESNRLVIVKNNSSEYASYCIYDNYSYMNYENSSFPVEADYQDIIFSNNDYLSIFIIEDVLYEGEDSNVVILDEFENDGLPYLKLLEKDRVHETVWIKKDHEFFDLFFIYCADDESDDYFQLDATFENE